MMYQVPIILFLGSDSETSEEENTTEGAAVIPEIIEDEETKKRERDALWASFQASVANPPKSSEAQTQPKKLVKIERRYRFAGEEVTEVVEVPEDSPEAKIWPLWKDPKVTGPLPDQTLSTLASSSAALEPISKSGASLLPAATTEDGTKSPTAMPSSASPTPTPSMPTLKLETKPLAKRPGPRKSRTTLGPIPGPSKAKKLTTLDKSALDWKTHLQEAGSSVVDELEANRRAGGYLEKVEFLKRVEERKEENLDAMKSNKRRKL
ncbi:bucentaur or craniofacial development-domain-containing protein [Gymnopilus junonius]|uniref:SWR1-complex protein 5 n=1 Tax=Gymnopilus junonius TaxID=109634 RepID=A0A9P5NK15_GYMJU|nr:bucentaur or craniofacial development-domain-containing protein [Gymnopilus junonius]